MGAKKLTKHTSGKRDHFSKYAAERYNPTFPHCGVIRLHFNGARLRMRGRTKTYTYPAVSGKPLANGRFDYSPARQQVVNVGPIPEGLYWIRPDELWENAFYKFWVPDSSWGNYRISIHPFTTTKVGPRGGFFIHGGSQPGSQGCIDLTSHMDTFVAELRAELGHVRTCQIHLEVDYP